VYVEFLRAVAKWASVTNTLVVDRPDTAGPLTSDELERLAQLVEQADASCVPLRL
jgi:aconitase B